MFSKFFYNNLLFFFFNLPWMQPMMLFVEEVLITRLPKNRRGDPCWIYIKQVAGWMFDG